MLELQIDEMVNEEIKQVITEFRRTQVSKYPIIAKYNGGQVVGFIDSRFPTDRYSQQNMACILWWGYNKQEKLEVTIESRLINNDKYSRHNSDYHTKKTTNPKNLLKYLKEYCKPFSAQEIAYRTWKNSREAFEEWKQQAYRDARRVCSFDWEDIIDELVNMKTVGYIPRSEKIQKALAGDGLDKWTIHKEIKDITSSKTHVFINDTDGAVTVTKGDAQEPDVKHYDKLDDAPEYVQQHIGMLRMMDNKSFVPHMGYKANDREFWLEGVPKDI
jgi:hypothetical protein